MKGEVYQDECRHQNHTCQCPKYDQAQVLHLSALPCNECQRHDASDVEEQEVELHPEEQCYADAYAKRMPPAGDVAVADEAQHVVEAMCHDRQRELFHAVAVAEEVGGVGDDAQKHQGSYERRALPRGTSPYVRRGRLRGREELHGAQGVVEEAVAADDLHDVYPDEVAPGEHGSRLVQEEEHGALVVEDVNIQFPAAEHGVSYGHIDVGVVPRIERIEERAGAEQCNEKHCIEEKEYRLFLFLAHGSKFRVHNSWFTALPLPMQRYKKN